MSGPAAAPASTAPASTAPASTAGRISRALSHHRDAGSVALIGWQTIGFPEIGAPERLVPFLVEGGFDLVELGIPFSDPMADGATIQRASHRALENGTTMAHAFTAVRVLRREGVDAPLLFMSYYNPILAMGLDRFAGEAAGAGLDGIIVPDLPPEESDELLAAIEPVGIDPIFLVAPTSTDDRLQAVAARARGFVYCVALAGVTGARRELEATLPAYLSRVRRVTELPLAVGFGISRPEHVAALRGQADAAVVASAIIDLMEKTPPAQHGSALRDFARSLRAAAGPPP